MLIRRYEMPWRPAYEVWAALGWLSCLVFIVYFAGRGTVTMRAAMGVAPLSWNAQLATDARVWADELAKTGRFEHSPDEDGVEPQGENLWAGTPRAFTPEKMVGLWVAEKSDYRPGVFPNNSRSGDVEQVGHYTQLIWRNSGQVGCATAVGKNEEFLVCRYSHAGNVYGERPA